MAQETYQLTIQTTDGYATASTSADVFIQLVGEDGCCTEWTKLNRFWRRHFKEGNTDIFDLTIKDVGIPIIVRLKLENKEKNEEEWGCDFVTVKYKDVTEEFPVYDWISDSIDVVLGKATLPKNVTNEHIQKSRGIEKERNESLYKWMPRAKARSRNWHQSRTLDVTDYDQLPHIFKYKDAHWDEISRWRFKARVSGIINKIKGIFGGISELDKYNAFHEDLILAELPSSHERWNQDEEFGRQMIDGNSRSIKRCKGLPIHCKITNQHLKGLLPEDRTLDEEIVKGHIYIVDHSTITAGITRNDQLGRQQLYCADATALFRATNGKLHPVGIQLEPGNPESIFTPNDDEYDWLLAKMYFRNADYMVHEWTEHFRGHIVMEPVVVSLFRNLSRSHPIYKLMRTHLDNIPAANQRGRDFLLGLDVTKIYRSQLGIEMTNRGHEIFDFNDLHYPNKLQKRGLMDTVLLPDYHFRDDALLYWDAIDKYVEKIVNHFYKSDNDVRTDKELQTWIHEIAVEGFLYEEGSKTNCPKNFGTIQELVTFVTTIIFHVSVYHAIIHFPQYEIFKFVPNAPAGMRLPIHKKGEGSLQRILDSLPTPEMSILQVSVSYVANRFGPNQTLLGQYPMRLFTETDVQAIMDEFSADLQEVGHKIRKRNTTRKIPNLYLLPERIPTTILG